MPVINPKPKSSVAVALGLVRCGRNFRRIAPNRCQCRKLPKALRPAWAEIRWLVNPIWIVSWPLWTLIKSVTVWGNDTSGCFVLFFITHQDHPKRRPFATAWIGLQCGGGRRLQRCAGPTLLHRQRRAEH